MKSFWPGFSDRQLPDGTVVVTTPNGLSYVTKPGAGLFFPAWNISSEPLAATPVRTSTPAEISGGTRAPKRAQPRAKARAARISYEGARNDDHVAERNIPPPF